MAVLIMGLSDIGFCVFSLGSICVGLMFWIRVVVAFLMFVYFLFDVFHFHLVYVSPVVLLLVCLASLWVAGGFLCRVLCISVLSLSRLCMISLGLVFFGFGTKDSPLLKTSFSAVVSILLLSLTIVSVVLGC